ncbi:MAG TPA: hypothetical protein VHF26_00335 [Trebonia sp.]|nr:hypothetical protein [Trebonia sp.]
MSERSAVSMQELELEGGEMLPGRETLCVTSYGSAPFSHAGHGTVAFSQAGYGNTVQHGLINVAAANGSLNNLNVLNDLHLL